MPASEVKRAEREGFEPESPLPDKFRNKSELFDGVWFIMTSEKQENAEK